MHPSYTTPVLDQEIGNPVTASRLRRAWTEGSKRCSLDARAHAGGVLFLYVR